MVVELPAAEAAEVEGGVVAVAAAEVVAANRGAEAAVAIRGAETNRPAPDWHPLIRRSRRRARSRQARPRSGTFGATW